MPPRRPPPIRSLAEAASAISMLWEMAFARQQVQVGGDLTGRPETPTLNPNAQALKHTLLGPRHTDTVQATPSSGSLVVGVGSTWQELPVGSSGQVLTVGLGGLLGWATGGGGGGGGAPTNAKYLTLGTDATLTDERVFAHSARLAHTDGGAGGNYTLDLSVSGVSAGSYTYAAITVDTYGRVTAASSGTAPVTSVSGTTGRIASTGGTTPVLDLATAGSAGTYAYPSSMTTDAYGRVTAVTAGSAPPTPPSPATTVVSEQTYGQSPATGTATTYAREDHTHGTPATPAHNTLNGRGWSVAGHQPDLGMNVAVAGWSSYSTPVAVEATADETMLVRRSGMLQWVPIVASVIFVKGGDIITDGTILDINGTVIYTGSIL